jgi:hypothetical protein
LTLKHFILDIKGEIKGIHRNLVDNEVRYVKRLVEREAKGMVVVLRRDKKTKLANLIKFGSDDDEDGEDGEDGEDDVELPSSTGSSPSSSSGATPVPAAVPRSRLGRDGVEAVEVILYSHWLL